ncbi:MAG: T9SS type A sorting domain-containing protein [Crocinitomicaceae bacterium]
MKRIYLLSSALIFGSVAFGQKKFTPPVAVADEGPSALTDKISNSKLYNFSKAPGDVIFSEDFNGSMGAFTVTPGTMDTIWKFDTNGPDGQYSSTTNADIINSTTASNGFMIFDADFSNPAQPFADRIGSLTSPVIDMTGKNSAIISFESRYRTCCANAFFLKVEVSTDDFATSQTYNVHLADFGVNLLPPTHTKKVNISDFLATATNKNNFKFRFFFDGAEGGSTSHYFWQVDDVKVYDNWTNDNTIIKKFLQAGNFGIPYYNTTVNQIAPIVFGASVQNDGTVASTGTILTTTISNGGTGTAVSTPITAAPGSLDTLATAAWTPTATSPVMYNFSHVISSTSADENPSDNTLLDSMNITSSTYGVDNGSLGSTFTNISGQVGFPVACGNVMEVINDDWITAVNISLNSTAANVGQVIKGEIWIFDAGANDYVYFAETDELPITSGNNNTTVSIPMLGGAVQIFAGDDLLVMQSNPGNGTTNVSVRTAQSVEFGVVQGVSAGATFGLSNPRAMRVSLELDPTLNVNEIEENLTISNLVPNPTTDVSTLNFTARNEQSVSVQVVDMTGKVMFSKDLGSVQKGGHSVEINSRDYNAGVYFVNVVSNDGVITKKLIKK